MSSHSVSDLPQRPGPEAHRLAGTCEPRTAALDRAFVGGDGLGP